LLTGRSKLLDSRNRLVGEQEILGLPTGWSRPLDPRNWFRGIQESTSLLMRMNKLLDSEIRDPSVCRNEWQVGDRGGDTHLGFFPSTFHSNLEEKLKKSPGQ